MSVIVNLRASMRCSEPGCKKSAPAELCLLATGGFGFRPEDGAPGWQINIQPQNGVFICFCKEHTKAVQVVQSLDNGEGKLLSSH